ncbi:D-alanyl-D-alanine carboxypeptidase [Lachnospiraceae bacterium OF09-6]|nr:D-alanyl-D-alanine carboxypeptidase [Lachnospiraceae bacterium OF09-6]
MKASRRRVLMTLIIWLAYIWPVSAGEVALPEELQNLYARSAVVMDGSSGRVLFGKNTEEVMPMASTTKIMTCILALEACTPDTVVTVSETAAAQPEVHLGASVGEKFYLEDLLYALMLESFNDAAVMIAEQVSGNVPAFAEQMNEKAKRLDVKVHILLRQTDWMEQMKAAHMEQQQKIWHAS